MQNHLLLYFTALQKVAKCLVNFFPFWILPTAKHAKKTHFDFVGCQCLLLCFVMLFINAKHIKILKLYSKFRSVDIKFVS